jgi:hypothetical protein
MSVVAFIGGNNIRMGNQGTFGGTSQMSNLWMGTTNVSLQTIYTARIYPRGAATGASFATFRSSTWRVIRLRSNDYAKGNVAFSYPVLTLGAGSYVGDNYAWSYLDYSYVTIAATAVYPYTFQRWETLLPTPAGTSLSTSSTVNLYNTDWTGYYEVKAVFA